MGWSFYELSGGADFEPQTRVTEQIAAVSPVVEEVPFVDPVVTRANTIELPTLTPEAAETVEAEVVQASLTTAVVAEEPAPEVTIDLRQVAGKRVNMRSGPGTNYGILDTLTRGTEAEILAVNEDGWAEVWIPSTGQTGWMAERLLTNG